MIQNTRTLQQLKESVETMIESQGKDAPVAAVIYTQEDVFELDSEDNPIYLPLDDIDVVLNQIEESLEEYVNDKVFVFLLRNRIRRLKIAKKSNVSQGESLTPCATC